jgi:hypothetical protein
MSFKQRFEVKERGEDEAEKLVAELDSHQKVDAPVQTDSLTLRRMAVGGLTGQGEGGRTPRPMSRRFVFPCWAATAAFFCHLNSTHRSRT